MSRASKVSCNVSFFSLSVYQADITSSNWIVSPFLLYLSSGHGYVPFVSLALSTPSSMVWLKDQITFLFNAKCKGIWLNIYVMTFVLKTIITHDDRKDTCELWLDEGWVKLVHLTSATVQEHDIHDVISYVPLAFNLHNTNTYHYR